MRRGMSPLLGAVCDGAVWYGRERFGLGLTAEEGNSGWHGKMGWIIKADGIGVARWCVVEGVNANGEGGRALLKDDVFLLRRSL